MLPGGPCLRTTRPPWPPFTTTSELPLVPAGLDVSHSWNVVVVPSRFFCSFLAFSSVGKIVVTWREQNWKERAPQQGALRTGGVNQREIKVIFTFVKELMESKMTELVSCRRYCSGARTCSGNSFSAFIMVWLDCLASDAPVRRAWWQLLKDPMKTFVSDLKIKEKETLWKKGDGCHCWPDLIFALFQVWCHIRNSIWKEVNLKGNPNI